MRNEDDWVIVSSNGEIYNHAALRARPVIIATISSTEQALNLCLCGQLYRRADALIADAALRRELEGAGHRVRTRSDTEAIIHGWEQWGPRCLEHLCGMFAFALWDRNRGELARDRLGKKPFHYAWLPNCNFAFASKMAALLALSELPRRLDSAAVDDFMALGYVPNPRSIYKGIRKLPAAHCMLLRRGAAESMPRRYWSPPRIAGPAPADAPAELAGSLRASTEGMADDERELAALVASRFGIVLPTQLKLRGGVGKHMLREAMGRHLSAEIFKRGKQGFGDAIGIARATLIQARLLGAPMLDVELLFDAPALKRLVEEHVSGRFDHAQVLWQLLVFQSFLAGSPLSPKRASALVQA